MKNNNIIYIIIIALLLGTAFFAWSYYKAQIREAEAKIEVERQQQNAAAYRDSMEMKARELQDVNVFVYNLQTENSKLKKENIYMKSKFVLVLDSLKILNQYAQTHNYGDSIVVEFEGRQGKITYEGQTTYFVLSDTGTYSLTVARDPIKVELYIYLNETDNLIYSKIYADSTLIDDVYTVVDSALYKKLKMPTTIDIVTPDIGFFNSLSIYGEYIQPFEFTEDIFIKPELNVGLNYDFKNGIGLKGGRNFLYNQWFIGIRYSLTPGSIVGLIF